MSNATLEKPGDRGSNWLIAVPAAVAAVAMTTYLLLHREVVEASFGRATPLLFLLALLFGAAIIRFSAAGVPLLVAFVYLNLSQALVRYHAFPSLLQLLVVGLFFAAWLKRDTASFPRVVRQAITVISLLLLLFTFASTAWASDLDLADDRAGELLRAFVIYLLATLLMHDRKRVMQGVSALLASAAFLGVIVMTQVLTGSFDNEFGGLARIKQAQIYGDVFQPRISGPLGDPNFFAEILLLAIPPAILLGHAQRSRGRKLAWFAVGALIVATLLVTYSRGAMLALGLMGLMGLKAMHIRWRTTATMLLIVLAIFVVLPRGMTERFFTIEQLLPSGQDTLHPDSSIQERRLLMTVAWVMFGDHPIGGVGVGNYSARYDDYVSRTSSAARQYADPSDLHFPHNLYLEFAAETGLVGLAIFAALIVAVWRALGIARRRFDESGDLTLSLLAHSFRISLIGFLAASLFLHLAFPRYLFLLFAFAAALQRLSDGVVTAAPAGGESDA